MSRKEVIHVEAINDHMMSFKVNLDHVQSPEDWGLVIAGLAQSIVEEIFRQGAHPPHASRDYALSIIAATFIKETVHPTRTGLRPSLELIESKGKEED